MDMTSSPCCSHKDNYHSFRSTVWIYGCPTLIIPKLSAFRKVFDHKRNPRSDTNAFITDRNSIKVTTYYNRV